MSLPDAHRDWVEVIGVFVALITFGYSVWTTREGNKNAHQDRQEALEQSRRDLRWRQTVEAQAAIRRLTEDSGAKDAMTMLDWTGRLFEVRLGHREEVTWKIMRIALRTQSGDFLPVEIFIRDAFDALFNQFEMIQQQIDNALFAADDVEYPVAYFSRRMKEPENWEVISTYLSAYEFPRARILIDLVLDRHEPPQADSGSVKPIRTVR